MARLQGNTTVSVLRGILGPIHGGELRFATLLGRSRSWVKKASAGVFSVSEEMARVIELETGVAREWLIGSPDAPPTYGTEGEAYTREYFEWHRSRVKAGGAPSQTAVTMFGVLPDLLGVGSAAGEKGKVAIFHWRLKTFVDDCREQFGFDEVAKSQAIAALNQSPAVAGLVVHDKGFDFAAISSPKVKAALKKAAKAKRPGEKINLSVKQR